MRKLPALLLAAGCLLTSACATRGGGPLGLVLFDSDQHVSGAEPLFGTDESRCFRNPTFGLSFVMPSQPMTGYPAACREITSAVRAGLGATDASTARPIAYTEAQRNEVIESFMSSSNYVCGDHMKFLQQWDGNVNSTLGLSSQAAAGIAAIVTGGAAQAAAAAAAFLGGARGTMQNAYFHNKTVGILAAAFQAERKKQRDEITKLEAKTIKDFPLSRGVEQVLNYHGSCSIVVGLAAAQRAVDQAQNPNLETIRDFFKKFEEVRKEAAKFVKETEPATGNTVGQE